MKALKKNMFNLTLKLDDACWTPLLWVVILRLFIIGTSFWLCSGVIPKEPKYVYTLVESLAQAFIARLLTIVHRILDVRPGTQEHCQGKLNQDSTRVDKPNPLI